MDMKAFIWDLDGTLLDSYGVIGGSLWETCRRFGIPADRAQVDREVIRHSVTHYLETVAGAWGLSFAEMKAVYSKISGQRKGEI